MARRRRRKKDSFDDLILPLAALLVLGGMAFGFDTLRILAAVFFSALLVLLTFLAGRYIWKRRAGNRLGGLHSKSKDSSSNKRINPQYLRTEKSLSAEWPGGKDGPEGKHKHANGPAPVSDKNLDNLSWVQFERLVADTYRSKGFNVELTADGADDGIDIILREREYKLLVQCKHWGSYSIGVNVARELYGVMHAEQAIKGILVTTGKLTQPARAFCKQNRIHWIERSQLKSFIEPRAMPPQNEIFEDRRHRCPLCGELLVKRRAKKTGNEFLGCPRFPRCRGTRSAVESA